MLILGLTGSIAMGKSTAAACLRRLGAPIHDADKTIHRLLARGGAAVAAVAQAFPGVLRDGAVDRPTLGAQVFPDRAKLRRLEAILHPLVRQAERRFLAAQARARRPVVVLDVPLLFETHGERRCDGVVVVSAPGYLQRQRALRRPGMTAEKLAAILARQTPDAVKRRRADWVAPTGLGKRPMATALRRALMAARRRNPRAWSPSRR